MSTGVSSCFNHECCNLENTENIVEVHLWCVCVYGFEGRGVQGKEVPKEGSGNAFTKSPLKIHSEALSD